MKTRPDRIFLDFIPKLCSLGRLRIDKATGAQTVMGVRDLESERPIDRLGLRDIAQGNLGLEKTAKDRMGCSATPLVDQ